MRYLTLASDYDGTLATDGLVGDDIVAALTRLRKSGRKLILVTGRELPELQIVFPAHEIFDWIVAENGALLYRPADRSQKLLAPAPPEALVAEIRRKGVERLSIGAAILATWRPYETALFEAIRDQGLDYHIIFNKDAVMALPGGVTKASGLEAALKEAGLSSHNVVGIGDAENDHAFLDMCELSVAVANAIDSLKQRVDLVTEADHGAGVVELIDGLLEDDLVRLEDRLERHHVALGRRDDGSAVQVKPYGENLLVAGSSGSGKSTLATGLIERLIGHGYRVCVVDPEGDYGALEKAVALGSAQHPPLIDEAVKLFLQHAGPSVVVNLVGIHLADRPRFFMTLLSRLQELRVANGQPHWIVIDEAHHVLPAAWEPAWPNLPERLDRVALVTLEADSIARQLLPSIDSVIAVGERADATLKTFAELRETPLPAINATAPPGGALMWRVSADEEPFAIEIARSSATHHRHVRKYAEGDLGPDRSFYFRGREGKLNLRAQNLMLFVQIAAGIDDDTWLFHLRQHDYSTWFREEVKDPALADETRDVEDAAELNGAETRERILALVTERYTAPASGSISTK
ncbi:MAG TPA: HAD-IIB family hydrolase [Pirellulales bacterium]|nr:HAD-IIB family hydrolase [Pirellulales bacterium]